MKRAFFALGLISVFLIVGCSSALDDASTSAGNAAGLALEEKALDENLDELQELEDLEEEDYGLDDLENLE